MRILVIGGGGREHAIIDSLSKSPAPLELFCAPGNGGTAQVAQNVAFNTEDPAGITAKAERLKADLVVIGPEAPLVAGTADMLRATGIDVFGPTASAAHLEGSKSFAKGAMRRFGVPTAASRTFVERPAAQDYLAEVGVPIVVKADGLAAGKGVAVCRTEQEASDMIDACFTGKFGDAGYTVVIEEMLVGQECSLLAFTDGETVRHMMMAQDHKPVFDGDLGPNTGGMGVYSPVPAASADDIAAMQGMLERVIHGFAEEGVRYRGVLYGGFILTDEGPKALEFNCRFGDPETQVLLPLLDTDLYEVISAAAQDRLHEVDLKWKDAAALSVVMASGGYPGEYEKGFEIAGIAEAEALEGVTVYHAGTVIQGGRLLTAGGRVLNVTATAPTLAQARDRAYEAVEMISFEGAHYRKDIGAKTLGER